MRVIVLTTQWPRPAERYCGVMVVRQVESLRRLGVEVDVIPIVGTLRSYVKAALTVLGLNFRPRRAELLHAHTGHAGVIACLQIRYPVVLSYVGYDIDDQLEEKQRLRRRLERAVFRALSLLFAATIVKSSRSEGRLPPGARPRARVIPNGVDRGLFVPIPREEARRRLGWGPEPTALFAADPGRQVKRFELAKAAVDLVRSSVPNLRLAIAHRVPVDHMPVWMNAADTLILSSRSEGSPNVVKEAMACNLPVVAVDVGDVHEVVGACRHCHVCPPDGQALADALREVIRALPERSDGRDRTDALDEQLIAQRVLEVYRAAVRQAPGLFGFRGRGSES